MRSNQLRCWIEATIFAALAMVLSFIPTTIGSSFSISLGMIPMTLYAFRRGVKFGFIAAFLWGLLHFLTGQVYFLTVSQVLIEYVLAFAFTGCAGFYATRVQKAVKIGQPFMIVREISIGTFLGCFARYFWHFIAGIIFWGAYALWGMSPIWFSFIMNGATAVVTGIVTATILSVMGIKWPKLFNTQSF